MGLGVFDDQGVLAQGAPEEGVPGGEDEGLAHGTPEKAHHGRAEDDEDPGVDDGVDGEETQGHQVRLVALLLLADGVDVHTDLDVRKRKRREMSKGSQVKQVCENRRVRYTAQAHTHANVHTHSHRCTC